MLAIPSLYGLPMRNRISLSLSECEERGLDVPDYCRQVISENMSFEVLPPLERQLVQHDMSSLSFSCPRKFVECASGLMQDHFRVWMLPGWLISSTILNTSFVCHFSI